MISKEILLKHNCYESLEKAKEIYGDTKETEIIFYQTFLKQTDYLALKLAEGVVTKEDYAEELEAREFARTEIRRLEMM